MRYHSFLNLLRREMNPGGNLPDAGERSSSCSLGINFLENYDNLDLSTF